MPVHIAPDIYIPTFLFLILAYNLHVTHVVNVTKYSLVYLETLVHITPACWLTQYSI